MPPIRRLIRGDSRSGKTARLAAAAAALAGEKRDATGLLALAVRPSAARDLRAALEARFGRDVPAAELRRRAIAILEQFPSAARLPPGWKSTAILSALDRRLLMQRAWASV